MTSPIHLFVPSFSVDETLMEIRVCLERGWTGLGFRTLEMEDAWKSYAGFEHAHFLNSATAGLHLAWVSLAEAGGWEEGDEVISTPLTFVSTNHVILQSGLRPVFADVDEHLSLDPRSVEERISARTRAVCFVGLGGNPGRLAAVAEICRRHELKLVLDAAHMAGTWLTPDRHVGRDADVTVFSFQAVKNLPTADSGMICFRDGALDGEARKWTWLGINQDTFARTYSGARYKWLYDVEHVGFKYHGNSIMASMGLVALRYLERDNERRREIAARYEDLVRNCEGIEVIPMAPCDRLSRHLFQVRVAHRDEVMAAMNRHDVFPGVHYRNNTLYRMYEAQADRCPMARKASEEIVSLPMHLRLSDEDVDRVASTLIKAVAAVGR